MNISFASYVVRFTDGSLDLEGTHSKFEDDLLRFSAERDTENAAMAAHIHAIFDQYKGARLNVPYLTGETLRRMGAQPANWKILSDKIVAFIQDNAQGKTHEDGSVDRPGSTFVISRGKGGGVARRADLPPKG